MPNLLSGVLASASPSLRPALAATLEVPAMHPKIQDAIDAGHDGDTVVVAPGVYRASLKIAGKEITLATRFLNTADRHNSDDGIDRDGAAAAVSGDNLIRDNRADSAELIERVVVAHHNFAGGEYGITGRDNLVLVNNVFTGIDRTALKRGHGESAAGKNLLWKNGTDLDGCNVKQDGFITAARQRDARRPPRPASPCIDAGTARLEFDGGTWTLPPAECAGRAPDLGAFESGRK